MTTDGRSESKVWTRYLSLFLHLVAAVLVIVAGSFLVLVALPDPPREAALYGEHVEDRLITWVLSVPYLALLGALSVIPYNRLATTMRRSYRALFLICEAVAAGCLVVWALRLWDNMTVQK